MDTASTHYGRSEGAIAEAKDMIREVAAVGDESAAQAVATLAVAEALLAVSDVLNDILNHVADPPA